LVSTHFLADISQPQHSQHAYVLLIKGKSAKMDVYDSIFEDGGDALPEEFKSMSAEDVLRRTRLLDNEIRVLKDDSTRLSLEHSGLKEKVCIPKLGP
jgi:hypothetical protein